MGRQAQDDVDVTALQERCPFVRIVSDLEGDPLQVGLRMVVELRGPGVFGIADHRDVIVSHPLLEPERSRPDGVPLVLAAELLHRRRGADAEVRPGVRRQLGEEGVGFLPADPHGVLVQHLRPGIRAQVARCHACARGRVDDPVVRVLHRVRVEGRPIVEQHAAPQVEHDALAIGRDIPRRRQPRDDAAVARDAHQRIVEVAHDGAARAAVVPVRIEGVGLRLDSNDQMTVHGSVGHGQVRLRWHRVPLLSIVCSLQYLPPRLSASPPPNPVAASSRAPAGRK